MSTAATETKTLITKLALVVAGMFGFVFFVMVPLYDVFCEVTGLNGKTNAEAYEAIEVGVDTSREITVQFVASNNDQMSWKFEPNTTTIKVHPGEATSISYFAKNPTQGEMVAQAIPSVSPGRAAEYFHKTECFCFNQQTLAGGESLDMPLRFIVDQDLPKDIKTITLSYTIFDVTPEKVASLN